MPVSTETRTHRRELLGKLADLLEYAVADADSNPPDLAGRILALVGDHHVDELLMLCLCAGLCSDLYDGPGMADDYKEAPLPDDPKALRGHLLQGLVIQAVTTKHRRAWLSGLMVGAASENHHTDLGLGMLTCLIRSLANAEKALPISIIAQLRQATSEAGAA